LCLARLTLFGGKLSSVACQSDPAAVSTDFHFGVNLSMSKKRLICVLLGLLVSAGPQAAELKVGVVDVAKLLMPKEEQLRKLMEREFSSRQKKLMAKGKEIDQMEEKLTRDAEVMGASERSKMEKDILSKKREAKAEADELREDANLKKNEEILRIQKEIYEAIKIVAKEEHYDIVLTEGVAYFDEVLDVTSKVEGKLGADYGSKASKSKAAE
jgi:outer membrane protein